MSANGNGYHPPVPCLGDLVMTLLAGTLSALRDRLALDGHVEHAEVVADLVDIVDEHVAHSLSGPERPPSGSY